MKKILASLGLAILLFMGCAAGAVDLNQVQKDLTTSGVVGWIHGDSPEHGLFVLTVRNPKDFFDAIQMSLVADQPDLQKELASLHRHDKVRIKGRFLANPSPQKHILVTSIEPLKPYDSGSPVDPYQYEAQVPAELVGKTSAAFLVHAVAGDGHILVTEYRDVICPIFVGNAELTRGLFRNDVVELKFKIQSFPKSPTHLLLDEPQAGETGSNPVRVVDSIAAKNGKQATLEGSLVLFPKSPEIVFNVFAIQENLKNGLKRQYTIVNQDQPEVFKKIREALQRAWDAHPREFINGRNKLVSTRVRVKATGILNEVNPSQANPQILVKDLKSVQIVENPE